MNEDEIIAMAREAGFNLHPELRDNEDWAPLFNSFVERLGRFAELAVAKDRGVQ